MRITLFFLERPPLDLPEHLTPDRYEGLPSTWSDSARETYVQIEEEAPNLTAAQRAATYEAVSLLALADEVAKAIDEHGVMTTGSQGQLVVNPAVSEVRALRRDALAALRAIGVGTKIATASLAGSALASKRWAKR
ncbi:hypothetical protein [Homoserinimonas hongtaonis]|uniref:hypothetical protein n=1 Tax=Homoserinimonas hongtaonis TaxID=2079791 RepID=UPI000D3A541D|nr:hypothetical protein [Salinibacterium hongtaonis]AWB88750.1 hypothetical protein C2138_03580 [Salinibacterium hongtaonis]